jgi:hypothetical protein
MGPNHKSTTAMPVYDFSYTRPPLRVYIAPLLLSRDRAYVFGESLLPHLSHMLGNFVQCQSIENAARIVELASTLAACPFLANLN